LGLNSSYVDVVVRRCEAFTGERAIREANGASFAAVANERRVDTHGAATA
jgi:hypothetical protein